MLPFSEIFTLLAAYALAAVIMSFFVLGLFLAANHKFEENGEEKGLILVGFKEALDRLFLRMDSVQALRSVRNVVALFGPLVAVGFTAVKILQTGDYNYLPLLSGLVLFLLWNKSYYDLGVFVLGCYRCMSTFWVALPMFGAGLYFGFNHATGYFWLIPGGIFSTAVVSGLVSYIYLVYDRCKLTIDEQKRGRALAAELAKVPTDQTPPPLPTEEELREQLENA